MANPLEQFAIKRYSELSVGGVDAAFTNSSLFMLIVLGISMLFFWLGSRNAGLVPGRWQVALEGLTRFTGNMLEQSIGPKGRPYAPFVFALFLFILVANLIGLVPYSFTVTSHIFVTVTFALLVFALCLVIGFAKHGLKFFKLFVPSSAPAFLLPIIVPIELISYLSRPLTHSVRLFANMTAGHILLKVFAGFVISMGAAGGIFLGVASVVPFLLTVAFYGLEVIVAVVQAYVFALLTCIYLNDSVNLE